MLSRWSRRDLIIAALVGSLGLLAGAFLFQFAGYAPCELCLWQRWPHAIAILIGVIAVASAPVPAALWAWLGAAVSVISAGLGVFHSGVERKWWDGLQSCSGDASGLTGNLLATDGPSVIPCNEIPWEMFGLSMANYNVAASLVFAALWIAAARSAR